MKKIICKKEYDTETATLIKAFSFGHLGDPAGYEERLYKTPEGKYFFYMVGGAQSPFPEETIKRVSAVKADEWLAQKN